MSAIRVVVPDSAQGSEALLIWVQQNIELFLPAMDLDVSAYDQLAQVQAVMMDAVDVYPEKVKLTYRLSYSVFSPCQQEYFTGGSAVLFLKGKRVNTDWFFEKLN